MQKFSRALILASFFSFSCLVGQELLETEIPGDLLFKESNRFGFNISPDGKYYADIMTNNIENDIIIVDIDGYELYQRIPMGTQAVQAIYWLTTRRLLYESNGAIFAIDIDGTNKKEIVNRMADVKTKMSGFGSYFKNLRFSSLLSTLPLKEHMILIETYDIDLNSSIKEVNIFTGQKLVLINGEKHKINKWILDANYQVRLGIRFKDDGTHYFEFDEKTERLTPLIITMDGKEYSVGVLGGSFLNQNLNFEGFSFNPDVIYLSSSVNKDKKSLISYNLKEKRVVEELVTDVNCDIREPHHDGLQFIFDYKRGEIGGLRYEGLQPQFKWFSTEMAEQQNYLNAKYPGFIHDFMDSDHNGNRHLIYQWNDVNEGNIGVYDTRDSTYAVMFQMNEELNKYKLSKTKSLVVLSRDNKHIPCYINLPLDYKEGTKVPLVVIPHGGPWVRDYWSLDPFTQFFTSRGYAALRVNFRGSTGFGKEHLLAGIKGLDKVMIDDIIDAVEKTKTNFSIQADNVFVFGHSYGGYATYMSMIKYPMTFNSGVAVSAPSDLKNWMEDLKKSDNEFAYDFWNMALGPKNSKYLRDISPLYLADRINNPVLIIHGENDRIISVDQSKEMEKAMLKNKKSVSFEMIRNEGHSFEDGNSWSYILNRAHSFFQKNIQDVKE